MNTNLNKPGFLCLVWLIALLSIELTSYSQQEIALATNSIEEEGVSLPKVCLRQTINDTVLPTLCNSGKGLVHCRCFSDKQKYTSSNAGSVPYRNPLAISERQYSETDWKILQEQQEFMQEQFQIQWQQQLRKEKMDIQLGEIIQGFYMHPPFK